MRDKRDISQGVVFDHDEMQWTCHQLRAAQAGIMGLTSEGGSSYSDGSSAYEGLSCLLGEIIKWLAPDDAMTEGERLGLLLSEQQAAASANPPQPACPCSQANQSTYEQEELTSTAIDKLDTLTSLLLGNNVSVNLTHPTINAGLFGMLTDIVADLRKGTNNPEPADTCRCFA